MRYALKLLPLLLNLALVPAAEGAIKLNSKMVYIKPVEIISISKPSALVSTRVKVSYQLACGEDFRGVLVRETRNAAKPHGPSVQLAVTVERTETLCSTLPVTRETSIALRHFGTVRPLVMGESKRIVLAEALDLSAAADAMVISWQSSCRRLLGVVLTPTADDQDSKIQLTLAQVAGDGLAEGKAEDCPRQLRRSRLTSISLPLQSIVLNAKPGHIEELFAYRLKAPRAMRVGADGALTVEWEKSCKEKAMGILFTGKSGSDIAIVAAFVPNAPCRPGARFVESYKLGSFHIPKGQTLTVMDEQKIAQAGQRGQFQYRLMPITSVQITRQGKGDWLLASGVKMSCSHTLGLIAGHDAYGNIALGALAAGADNVCPISQTISGDTLTAPLVGPSQGPMPRVYGLRVFGTTFN